MKPSLSPSSCFTFFTFNSSPTSEHQEDQGKKMYRFNFRFLVPFLINIPKIFQEGILGWDWDPYNIVEDLSLMKGSGLLLLLLAFSFFSVETLLITPSQNPRSLRLSLSGQYFSISMALSLLASLISPQKLFWFINPLIILPSVCSPPGRILNLLISLHAAASTLPGCSILITATGLQTQLVAGRYSREEGSGGSGASSEESEEDGELEANDVGDRDQNQDQEVVVTIDDQLKT